MKVLNPCMYSMLLCIFLYSCTKAEFEKIPPVIPAAPGNLAAQISGMSIVQLRAKKIERDSVYVTAENGVIGKWNYDADDKKSEDNLGTILVSFESKRLKRIVQAADPVRSEWFGLKSDGSDQTLMLQAAIDASAGKTLLLQPGVYFSKKIQLVSHLVLQGDHAVLRNIQGENIDNIFINLYQLTDVEITGVEIALNGIRGDIWAGTAAVQIQNCSNIRIHDCFVHDNTYVGIRLTGGNKGIFVNHNTIENTDTGIHANNDNSDVSIIGNIITKGTSEGITIYGYTESKIPFNFLIDSNIIQHKQNSFGINIAYGKLGTIQHNTISDCLGGITLHDVISVGSEAHYTTDMNINHNLITNTGFGIIYIGDRTIVSDNILSNVQQDGINVNNYPDESVITDKVTISNNKISGAGSGGGARGGISVRNLHNSSIDNNVISNSGKAFAIRFDANCANLAITANNLKDGMLQSTNKKYDNPVFVSGNTLSASYFPVDLASAGQFKLIVAGNNYTSDTSYNTAPDNSGNYRDLNTFNIRSTYFLQAGSIKTIIPSWIGRIIRLKSLGSFAIASLNNIKLKGQSDVTITKDNSISLEYDGQNWNELSRTF